jgi:predicted phage tail protein
MAAIYGSGGGGGGKGGGGGGQARTPRVRDDNLDSRQYAKVLDLISEGEIQGLKDGLRSIFLNNTPLQNPNGSFNFQGLSVDSRTGTQNQSYISGFDRVEDIYPVGVVVERETPITRTITDPNVDAVSVTIGVPQLQQQEAKTGDIGGYRFEFRIEVQYNGGGFNTVLQETIKGRTADLFQRSFLINLNGPAPYDIKMVRLSQDDDEYTGNKYSSRVSAFNWTSYTEITYTKLRYPNSALVGLRVDAEQFSSIPSRAYHIRGIKVRIPNNATVDQSNGRLVYNGFWNGAFSAAQWCSDPAWILWDLLTSKRYAFGDHVQESQLDKWAFFSASKYCSELVPNGFGGYEPRFSCNVNIQTAEEAYKLINDMCSVFRAMPYWSTGALTINQDKPADTSYLFTLANVTEEGFSYQGASRKTRPTVCVVSYLDLNTRDTAYEVVEDQEGIQKYGVIKTEISAFACTSRGQAHRIGEWLLYSERYESEVISFTASLDAGVIVRPGQIIEVADPVKAGVRRGGRISAATTTAVTVDDATGLIASGAELSVIMPNGKIETRDISRIDFFVLLTEDGFSLLDEAGSTIGLETLSSSATLTVASAFSAAPNVNSVWVYQTSNIQTSTWRVLAVGEQDGINYPVTAIAYNASKYAYIERGVALEQRDITDLNIIPPSPTNLTAQELLYDAGGIAKAKLIVSWRPVEGVTQYRIEWRKEDDNWTSSTQSRPDYEIIDTTVSEYEIRVFSLIAGLRSSVEPAQLNVQTFGKTAPPATPTGISIIPNSDTTAILSWDRSTELDVVLGGKVLIRHSTLLTGAVWQDSQEIVTAAAGSQTQKQVPLLEGTYLIKFEDDSGNRSAAPATAAVDLPTPQPRLLVQSYREDQETPPFSGNVTNMIYSSEQDGLILSLGELIDSLATDGNWDGLGTIDGLSSSLGSGEYEFGSTYDLGGVFDLNLRRYFVTRPFLPANLWDDQMDLIDTWPTIDGDVLDQVNAVLYVRTTDDDPGASPTWSDWHEFANAIVRGRAFQFKTIATSFSESQNIIIDELGAELELQQRTESAGSITSGASSYAVTFDEAFYQTPAVGITAYNMGTGDYYAVTSQSRTGFTVTFYDSTTTVISRDFTYIATGYGREIV